MSPVLRRVAENGLQSHAANTMIEKLKESIS